MARAAGGQRSRLGVTEPGGYHVRAGVRVELAHSAINFGGPPYDQAHSLGSGMERLGGTWRLEVQRFGFSSRGTRLYMCTSPATIRAVSPGSLLANRDSATSMVASSSCPCVRSCFVPTRHGRGQPINGVRQAPAHRGAHRRIERLRHYLAWPAPAVRVLPAAEVHLWRRSWAETSSKAQRRMMKSHFIAIEHPTGFQ